MKDPVLTDLLKGLETKDRTEEVIKATLYPKKKKKTSGITFDPAFTVPGEMWRWHANTDSITFTDNSTTASTTHDPIVREELELRIDTNGGKV